MRFSMSPPRQNTILEDRELRLSGRKAAEDLGNVVPVKGLCGFAILISLVCLRLLLTWSVLFVVLLLFLVFFFCSRYPETVQTFD